MPELRQNIAAMLESVHGRGQPVYGGGQNRVPFRHRHYLTS
jgi:hypothetical protein